MKKLVNLNMDIIMCILGLILLINYIAKYIGPVAYNVSFIALAIYGVFTFAVVLIQLYKIW